jgi:hypothetical protein
MNILESIMGARDGAAVQQLATQFGLKPEQASAAVGALMPALAAGLARNMATNKAGLESALANGHHEAYIDQPEVLGAPATTADGNAILGHIFGSKDVSRNVAAGAAQKSGVDSAVLKKMLPLVASLAMGAMAKAEESPEAPGSPAVSRGCWNHSSIAMATGPCSTTWAECSAASSTGSADPALTPAPPRGRIPCPRHAAARVMLFRVMGPRAQEFYKEVSVGLFDKKEEPKADFSKVQSGSSTRPDASAQPASAATQLHGQVRRHTVRHRQARVR